MDYQDIASKLGNAFNFDKKKQEQLNQKKANKVMEQYQESKMAKQEITQKWIEHVKLWRGDHWKKNRPAWKSKTVENVSFSIIETMIPLLGDRQPKVNFYPQSEEDRDAAEKLNQASQYTWNVDDMDEKFPTMLRDMLILGTGVLKMRWDTDKFNGMGDITADVVDPFHIFVDPEATDPSNMQWLIFKTKIPIEEIKQTYGVEVPADSEYEHEEKRPTTTEDNANGRSKTQATVLEKWYYENGRMSVCVVANGHLLEEKESPYETNDFPFIFFYDYKLNGEFWGYGEYENLKPLQYELNKVRAMLMDNMIATNNTMIVVDSTAGVNVKELRNEPGLAIEKQPGGRIERLAPPHLPPHFQEQMQLTKQSMEDVSGVNDITRGVANGQTSGEAISILQEASQTRLRGKLQYIEAGVKKMSRWYLTMYRQFYTEPRLIRLTDDEAGFKFVEFDGTEMRSEVPVINPETGEPEIGEDGLPITETRLTDFDVQIQTGSTMLLNKSAKYQQNLELFNSSALDIETLLESAEIGDAKEITQRMIKYGVLPDPNAPKVNIKQVLGDLGIKVNMTTNDPESVLEAIQNAEQQLREAQEMTNTPPKGDMKQQLKDINKTLNGQQPNQPL